MKKILTAGDNVESRCTRCRRVTNHIIVAMVQDRVVRVQCNTCDGVHNYYPPTSPAERSPRAAAAPAAPRPPRAGSRRGQSADLEEWQELSRTLAGPRRPYAMDSPFQVNDLVEHPVFGLGVVRAVARPNKMEVLFQDGRKVLRCSLS